MKKSLLSLLILGLFFIEGFTKIVYSQVTLPHYDGMNYTVGSSLQTQTGWTSVNSGDDILVAEGNLSYAGLTNSTGNKITFNGSGIDASKAIVSQTTGTVYFSFIIKVTDVTLATLADGGYFTGLGSSTTVFGATIWLKKNAENFNIGINPRSSSAAATVFSASTYAINTEILIVASYQFNSSPGDDVVKLWINPSPSSFGGLTEPTADITVTNTGGTDLTAISNIFIRQDSDTETPFIQMDELRVSTTWADVTPADVTSPSATFLPVNGSGDVAVNVTPTITFDEPVRKTDGTELVNADLATLITFKKTDASGTNVAFSAAIDVGKKVITVTPSAVLDNSQLYYLAIGAVEDLAGNEMTSKNITFTTISAAAPSVTLTGPVGGETFHAGQATKFTWTSANITSLTFEAWVPDDADVYAWQTILSNIPAAPGECDFNIPADAPYGTEYKIRVSDMSNPSVNSVSGNFTLIGVATSITDLRTNFDQNDIVQLSSEATVTFLRPSNRNQKYIQDAGAGLLIDDPSGVLTTVVAIGDNIKGLEGKLGNYGGALQIVPTVATVTVVSSGNTVTIPEMTIPQYTASYLNYESMLIKLKDVYFSGADGSATFAPSANYTLTDGTNTVTFRTFYAGDGNIVGTVIPVSHINLTAIAGFYNTTIQVYSRTTSDFELITGIENASLRDVLIYPIPVESTLRIANMKNVLNIEILDITARVIISVTNSNDNEISIPVGRLNDGMYFIRFTTPDGKVIRRFIKQ